MMVTSGERERPGSSSTLVRIATCLAALLLTLAAGAPTASAQSVLDRPAGLVVQRTTLAEALLLLQARARVSLAYSPDLIPNDEVSCDCETRTVGEALDVLLEGTGLTFRVSASRVLILPRSRIVESRGVVRGEVVDDSTGAPVANVAVSLDTGQGVLADDRGHFVLRGVPFGRRQLEVAGMGWATWRREVVVAGGDTVRVVARLHPSAIPLPEIVVAPGTFGILEGVPPGAVRTITRSEIETMPQLGEDVFRSLTRLPGVSSHDISTRLSVRGSLDREILVRLDGMDLYEPYHLPDFDGVFGIVDLTALSGVELRAGGFGVEYGNGTAGVLDMRSRTAVGPPRTTASLNVSHLSLVNEGGFADGKGSWLASVRGGSLGLLLKLVGADDRLSPQFYDAFGKVSIQPGRGHLLTAHVLHAGDRFRVEVDEPGVNADGGIEQGHVQSDWSSSYGWITWDARLGERVSAQTQLQMGRLTRLRDGRLDDFGDVGTPEEITVLDDRSFDVAGVREEIEVEVSSDFMVRVGGEVLRTWADYDYFATTATPVLTAEGFARLSFDTLEVATEPHGDRASLFASARGRAGPLTAEAGVRYDRTTLPRESHFAPRAQASLDLGASTKLRASAGRYYQAQGIGDLQVGDGQTLYSPAVRSDLFALGVEQRVGGTVGLRIEAYDRRVADQQRRFFGLEQELDLFPEQQGDRLSIDPGRGRLRGVELFLEGRLGTPWRWTASYALSKAEDEIPQTGDCTEGPTCLDDPWVPRAKDQRHAVNLQLEYHPNDRWEVAASWIYHSGWPVTAWTFGADLKADGTPFFTRTFGPLRAERLGAYHRLDLRATRTFVIGGRTLEAYADLFNVYDRRNHGSRHYALTYLGEGNVRTIPNDEASEELLPFLPMVGLRVRF